MSDFDGVEEQPPQIVTRNETRLTMFKIGLWLGGGFAVLSLLFSVWSMAEGSKISVGAFLFTFFECGIRIMLLAGIWGMKWVELRAR